MSEFNRGDILDKHNYQFDMSGEESTTSSKKSWWVIGLIIGFGMNLIAFLLFYIFHKREHVKKIISKKDVR